MNSGSKWVASGGKVPSGAPWVVIILILAFSFAAIAVGSL